MTNAVMVDTHCHLNFNKYDDDRNTIVQGAIQAGVTRIIIPAVDVTTAHQALDLSQQYDGVYAAVGIHPTDTKDFNDTMLADIEKLSHEPKVVAIGEIGLDYYWDKSPKEKQVEAFKAHLALAKQRELPVIIHNREASDDIITVLEEWTQDLPEKLQGRAGVLHSFSGNQEIAERAVAIGFYLGFTGPITFKKAEELRSIARATPLDRILVETDGPFLTPEPYRGKRNKPEYIPYIVDRIASLKGITQSEMAQASTENALRLFELDKF